MKKVVVTGASGFIGRHCLPLLLERGYEVHALTFGLAPVDLEGVHWIDFNLLNADVKELLASLNPTHLLHLAWSTEPGKYWSSMDNLKWLKASFDLLEAFAHQGAHQGGKRAVCAGTCAEYDWSAAEFEEYRTPCTPHTLYGSSKLSLRLILEALSKQMGFSHAWGRVFYLFGPHEYPQRFVPSVINGLLQQKAVPCSHGNQVRDFLHVRDVADAFVTLLDSEVQGVVNIGSGEGISLKQVIYRIAERLGGENLIQLGALAASPNEPARLVATTERLREEVHWKPRFTLEEGLEDAILWWEGKMCLS